MSRLQKHEREFVKALRANGVRYIDVNKRRGGHPRITGDAPTGKIFKTTIASSPSDRNAMKAALRQAQKNISCREEVNRMSPGDGN